MTEDAQALDARGCPIPLPQLVLTPCFWCLVVASSPNKLEDGVCEAPARSSSFGDCEGKRYIRLDPEAFPIARDHRAQETPAS